MLSADIVPEGAVQADWRDKASMILPAEVLACYNTDLLAICALRVGALVTQQLWGNQVLSDWIGGLLHRSFCALYYKLCSHTHDWGDVKP